MTVYSGPNSVTISGKHSMSVLLFVPRRCNTRMGGMEGWNRLRERSSRHAIFPKEWRRWIRREGARPWAARVRRWLGASGRSIHGNGEGNDKKETLKTIVLSYQDRKTCTGCPTCSWTGLGWLGLILSARFCLGWCKFGRSGWAKGQDGGTPKSKPTQPRSTGRWDTPYL